MPLKVVFGGTFLKRGSIKMEKSKAQLVRQMYEMTDEPLIDLLLAYKEKLEPHFDINGVSCPLCQGDTIEITETAEGDSERVYFQMKCAACGCEFVLVEDLINACRRGIANAEEEIEYNKNKIDYFKKKLEGE